MSYETPNYERRIGRYGVRMRHATPQKLIDVFIIQLIQLCHSFFRVEIHSHLKPIVRSRDKLCHEKRPAYGLIKLEHT